jgi:hypothetical protein
MSSVKVSAMAITATSTVALVNIAGAAVAI